MRLRIPSKKILGKGTLPYLKTFTVADFLAILLAQWSLYANTNTMILQRRI